MRYKRLLKCLHALGISRTEGRPEGVQWDEPKGRWVQWDGSKIKPQPQIDICLVWSNLILLLVLSDLVQGSLRVDCQRPSLPRHAVSSEGWDVAQSALAFLAAGPHGELVRNADAPPARLGCGGRCKVVRWLWGHDGRRFHFHHLVDLVGVRFLLGCHATTGDAIEIDLPTCWEHGSYWNKWSDFSHSKLVFPRSVS